MAPDEYNKALDKALADLEGRVQQRDLLNAEIAGLKETVRVLSSRVELPPEKRKQVAQLIAMVDSATPNLTDAVRALLTKEYPKEMTAVEVRNALEDSSNFDDFSNSLSACHAALKRMLVDGDVELGVERNGKATYRRIIKLEPLRIFGGRFTNLAALSSLDPNKLPEEIRVVIDGVDNAKRPAHEQAMRDAMGRTPRGRTVPPPPGTDSSAKEPTEHPAMKLKQRGRNKAFYGE